MLWLVKIITGLFLDKSIRGAALIRLRCMCCPPVVSGRGDAWQREPGPQQQRSVHAAANVLLPRTHTRESGETPRIVQLPTPRYNSTVKNNGALDSVVYACAAAGILPVLFYLLRAIGGHMFLNSVKQLI
jgi:hypothetical protein